MGRQFNFHYSWLFFFLRRRSPLLAQTKLVAVLNIVRINYTVSRVVNAGLRRLGDEFDLESICGRDKKPICLEEEA